MASPYWLRMLKRWLRQYRKQRAQKHWRRQYDMGMLTWREYEEGTSKYAPNWFTTYVDLDEAKQALDIWRDYAEEGDEIWTYEVRSHKIDAFGLAVVRNGLVEEMFNKLHARYLCAHSRSEEYEPGCMCCGRSVELGEQPCYVTYLAPKDREPGMSKEPRKWICEQCLRGE